MSEPKERASARPATVFFSFRSPFSWMTVHELHRRRPDADRLVTFVPYWDPDARTEADLAAAGAEFHYVQMSRAKHRYILHDTKRLATRLGLPMVWPIDRDPWWEVPHLAWLHADRLGAGRPFYDAVVTARWERGEDVCQRTTVAKLAESVGLDGTAAAGAVDDDDLRAQACRCLTRAYHEDVFGIPYLRVGRDRFWGYDRLDLFLAALDGVAPAAVHPGEGDADPPVLADGDALDTDTAGGCG